MTEHAVITSGQSAGFLSSLLDSLDSTIVVTDLSGHILHTNRSWREFGEDNAACETTCLGVGINYFDTCRIAVRSGEIGAKRSLQALMLVAEGHSHLEYVEYPCHSATKKRWFTMRVSRFDAEGKTYLAIMHIDITTRKLAELRALSLAIKDPLTNLNNRRDFDATYEYYWDVCKQENSPLTLALIDIDYFKAYNDHYGHSQGDQCLKDFSALLENSFISDSSYTARIGGEEFAVILMGLSYLEAREKLETFKCRVEASNIPHQASSVSDRLTLSAGAITCQPASLNDDRNTFYDAVDELLYVAKRSGRNQITHEDQVQAND